MNTKIISSIVFKLFAIYILVSGIIILPGILSALVNARRTQGGEDVGILWPLLISVATIIVAILAFRMLWRLGNKAVENISDINQSEGNIDVGYLEKTLFSLMGVYFVISAITELPRFATSYWVRTYSPAGITVADYGWFASLLVQILFGLALLNRQEKLLSILKGKL